MRGVEGRFVGGLGRFVMGRTTEIDEVLGVDLILRSWGNDGEEDGGMRETGEIGRKHKEGELGMRGG